MGISSAFLSQEEWGGLRSQISELDSHIDEAAAKVHVLDDAVVEARLDGVAGHQIDSGREGHRIVHRIVRVVVVVQQRLRVDQKRHLDRIRPRRNSSAAVLMVED